MVLVAQIPALAPRRELVHLAPGTSLALRPVGPPGEMSADPILVTRGRRDSGDAGRCLEDHRGLLEDLAGGGAFVLEAFHHCLLRFFDSARGVRLRQKAKCFGFWVVVQ